MKCVLRKHKSTFVPVGDEAWGAHTQLHEGQEVLVEIKAKRNVRRHRLMWKLASIIHENSDFFPSRDCAMDAIKIGCGHCEVWVEPVTGVVHQRPKSIAFHEMEELDFMDFQNRAISLISTWLGGMDDRTLLAKVNEALDYRGAAERRAA